MREAIVKIALILALAACILFCMTDTGQQPEVSAYEYDEASRKLCDGEAGWQGSTARSEGRRPLQTEAQEAGTEAEGYTTIEAAPVPVAQENEEETYAPAPLPTPHVTWEPQRMAIQLTVKELPDARKLFAEYFPNENYDETVNILAKVLWGEAYGVYERSKTNCAAVVWCVLNRVDEGEFGDNPRECATAGSQFAYSRRHPVKKYFKELAEDVLIRWLLEKAGEDSVGRVLPKGYCFFSGNGKYNTFRKGHSTSQKRLTPKTSEVYGE